MCGASDMEETRNAYNILVGRLHGKRVLGRDNIFDVVCFI
jgi:hypothetical protein